MKGQATYIECDTSGLEQKRFETRSAVKACLAALFGAVTMPNERWAHCLFPTDRVPSSSRVPAVHRPLLWSSLPEEAVVLGSISRHGLRPVDLPREPTRHRGVPALHRREALSHGIPQPCGTLDAGGC